MINIITIHTIAPIKYLSSNKYKTDMTTAIPNTANTIFQVLTMSVPKDITEFDPRYSLNESLTTDGTQNLSK